MRTHSHQVKNCSERLADVYAARRAFERLGSGVGARSVMDWIEWQERDLWRVLSRPIWC